MSNLNNEKFIESAVESYVEAKEEGNTDLMASVLGELKEFGFDDVAKKLQTL